LREPGRGRQHQLDCRPASNASGEEAASDHSLVNLPGKLRKLYEADLALVRPDQIVARRRQERSATFWRRHLGI